MPNGCVVCNHNWANLLRPWKSQLPQKGFFNCSSQNFPLERIEKSVQSFASFSDAGLGCCSCCWSLAVFKGAHKKWKSAKKHVHQLLVLTKHARWWSYNIHVKSSCLACSASAAACAWIPWLLVPPPTNHTQSFEPGSPPACGQLAMPAQQHSVALLQPLLT